MWPGQRKTSVSRDGAENKRKVLYKTEMKCCKIYLQSFETGALVLLLFLFLLGSTFQKAEDINLGMY